MNKQEVSPAVLDRRSASDYIGLSLSVLNGLTMSGKISSIKVGRRRVYLKRTLDQWLEQQEGEGQ